MKNNVEGVKKKLRRRRERERENAGEGEKNTSKVDMKNFHCKWKVRGNVEGER